MCRTVILNIRVACLAIILRLGESHATFKSSQPLRAMLNVTGDAIAGLDQLGVGSHVQGAKMKRIFGLGKFCNGVRITHTLQLLSMALQAGILSNHVVPFVVTRCTLQLYLVMPVGRLARQEYFSVGVTQCAKQVTRCNCGPQ